jgi:hypothetical protein
VARARAGTVAYGPGGVPRPRERVMVAKGSAALEGVTESSSAVEVREAVRAFLRSQGLPDQGVRVRWSRRRGVGRLQLRIEPSAGSRVVELLQSALSSSRSWRELGSGTDLLEGERDLEYERVSPPSRRGRSTN